MKFNLLVTGGLYSSQASYSALRFSAAAVQQGHEITQVFFYQDGVTQGSRLSVPLSDEFDSVSHWVTLSEAHQIKLLVCVSAAERRGVLNAEQASEHGVGSANLHPAFSIAGLGELHAASVTSDRTVSFK